MLLNPLPRPPAEEIRPLVPLVGNAIDHVEISAEAFEAWRQGEVYNKLRTYFEGYPARSLMGPHSRAVLFSLVRMLRPKVVAEIGTLFAGTTETLARALWENGSGEIHTTDPFDAEGRQELIGAWPEELRSIAHFYRLNSMDFFSEMHRQRIGLDMVLVDGNHDFEFALYDLQMAARLLRPGGIIIMDNSDQTGPFHATRSFMAHHLAWREIGGALDAYDPSRPFDTTRTSMPPGTFFIVLRAPAFVSISVGPHGWGQVPTQSSIAAGLSLELPPQATSGTLYYQAFLRGFANHNRDIAERKTTGSIRIVVNGTAVTVVHPFAAPLQTDIQSRFPDAHLMFELDLSWKADPGAPPLALMSVPSPLAALPS
jgi:predicted O-methyltransferase YrrM